MFVSDFVQTEFVRIHPDATMFEAAEKILAHNVETLLVFENDRLVGVVGLRDLFTAPIPEHYGNVMPHRNDEAQFLVIWSSMRVRDLMNETVLSVREDTPPLRALEVMVNGGKHPLPGTRAGKVIGTISRKDIVRALAAQRRNSA